MKILITGADGQLGKELQEIYPNYPQHNFFFANRTTLDITDKTAIDNFFAENQVEAVINGAAYTQVDKAESDQEKCFLVNATGVEHIAKACAKNNALLLHISSDYVFDGTKTSPYLETDPTCPLGIYGESKLKGEQAALQNNPKTVIIRTSWLYARFGHNFLKTMLRLGKERPTLTVVNDQKGVPTFAGDLATTLLSLIDQSEKIQSPTLLQYVNEGECTWYDFACRIMEQSGSDCKVSPIPSSAYPTPAKRPAYSLLSTAKIQKEFNIKTPHWTESADKCIKYLMSKNI